MNTEGQDLTPFEHLFSDRGMLIRVKIEQLNTQITYRININEGRPTQVTFSNGQIYTIYQNENQESYIRQGQQECGKLSEKINQLEAILDDGENQIPTIQKGQLVIELIDINQNANFVTAIDQEYLNQNTNNTQLIEDAYFVLHQDIKKAFNPQSQVQIIYDGTYIINLILSYSTQRQQRSFKLIIRLQRQQLQDSLALQVRQQIIYEILSQSIQNIQNQQNQQEQAFATIHQLIDQLEHRLQQNQNDQRQQNDRNTGRLNIMSKGIRRFNRQARQQVRRTNSQEKNIQKNIITVSPAQFNESNNELYKITEIFTQDVVELKFILEDDEIEFAVGILLEGDFNNLDFHSKCFLIKFPKGLIQRGDKEDVNFVGRPFFRRDIIVLRVDLTQKLFIVTINNYQLIPINLSQTFNSFAFILKSQTQLNEIIADPE